MFVLIFIHTHTHKHATFIYDSDIKKPISPQTPYVVYLLDKRQWKANPTGRLNKSYELNELRELQEILFLSNPKKKYAPVRP